MENLNQSELEKSTRDWRLARENACDQSRDWFW